MTILSESEKEFDLNNDENIYKTFLEESFDI
jgi:hypothetical protein